METSSVPRVSAYGGSHMTTLTVLIILLLLPFSVLDLVQAGGITKAGPWGGTAGREWETGPFTGLHGFKIRSAEAVDAFTVLYEEGDGQMRWSPPYGGQGGYPSVVKFKNGEYLTSLSGYIAPFGSGNTVITSLTFGTNINKYGPYGNEEGTPFSFSPTNGEIVGFFGRASSLLDAIGVYVKSINIID